MAVVKKKKVKKTPTDYFEETGTLPDYKDVLILKRYISERGKIFSQKITGLSSKSQRAVSAEIKKARYMALLPYTERHSL